MSSLFWRRVRARWVGLAMVLGAPGWLPAATRELYVWQRQSGPEVVEALNAFRSQVDGVCVLAAEVSWTGGRRQVVRTGLDYAALSALKKPVGLALRIGPFAGPFAADDPTARALAGVAESVLAQAQAAGLAVAEIQIDFDVAESKLAGYRAWLGALRRAAGRTPLTFTALPAWLKHGEFAELARAADGFVLQVHSLERPTGPDAPFLLCDPLRAAIWARQAGLAGVPFRVALPTYGYLLGFDPAGKFIGLAAEGPRREWPAGTQLRVVRADAPAMARLARELVAEPPRNFTGVIWYRLPVAGDRLNWDATTLALVLRGQTPARAWRAEVSWPEPGLAEIAIVNRGQTTEPLPAAVALRWAEDARVLAADGLAGFVLETYGGRAQGIVRAAKVPADAFLAPGRRATIAWLRFTHEVSLEAELAGTP